MKSVGKNQQRESNLEALRIVAMLLVIVVHCTFFANGGVDMEWLESSPFGAFLFASVEALALVCVNLFVLISGYFSIKFKFRGLLKLLFIVYFWRYALFACAHFFKDVSISVLELIRMLNPFEGQWFIGCYLSLYLLSPLLNLFVVRLSKDELKKSVIIYVLLMLVFGWIIPGGFSPFFNFANGYSVYSLIGLYLIGRYIKLHVDLNKVRKSDAFIVYVLSSMINALVYLSLAFIMLSPFLSDTRNVWFISYNSIFVLVGSVALFIAFAKMRFQNKVVNWLAASALSIYIIHLNPYVVSYFLQGAQYIKAVFWPYLWLPAVLVYSICVYIVCAVADQVRRLLWLPINKALVKFDL